MNSYLQNFNFSIILTACINPVGMPFLLRNSTNDRLSDYKNAFRKWCNNSLVQKIIFIMLGENGKKKTNLNFAQFQTPSSPPLLPILDSPKLTN